MAGRSHFHGSAPAAFFRRARIEELGLRFDPEVRPNFEDGHFCVRYLLAEDRPAVGFVKTAIYQYRKRSDASSTLQTSMSNPDRYTKAVRNGYLAVLRESLAGRERPPEWLQNYIVYELSWYFTTQDAHAATGGSASGEVAEEFHALDGGDLPTARRARGDELPTSSAAAESASHPDSRLCDGCTVARGRRLGGSPRHPARPGADPLPLHRARPPGAGSRRWGSGGAGSGQAPFTHVPRAHPAARAHPVGARAEHHTSRPRRRAPTASHRGSPAPAVRSVGRRPPQGAGRRSIAGSAAGEARAVATRSGSPAAGGLGARAAAVRRCLGADGPRCTTPTTAPRCCSAICGRARPKINAWFVIESGTPDWERLREAGYKRIVAHGSTLWKLLMLNARHLISSHADVPVMAPPEILRLVGSDVAVHLPAARRDQGRPVRLAQSQERSTPS